ncbi:MAG: hypothetical protein M1355_03750 [Patescibacteria group bacterium]|nr:hypothetical protein [Patescibacteria group bacterium]
MKKEEKIKKAVEVFNEIRDIPYHIALGPDEEGNDCDTKNKKLIGKLQNLGYQVQYRVGLFRWSEQNLPKGLIKIKHDDESSHSFLEVIAPSESDWIQVDATWDPKLGKASLPIAEWDGKSSTPIAIKCYKILPVEETKRYLDSIDFNKDLKDNFELYKAFNEYCDSFRKASVIPTEVDESFSLDSCFRRNDDKKRDLSTNARDDEGENK